MSKTVVDFTSDKEFQDSVTEGVRQGVNDYTVSRDITFRDTIERAVEQALVNYLFSPSGEAVMYRAVHQATLDHLRTR